MSQALERAVATASRRDAATEVRTGVDLDFTLTSVDRVSWGWLKSLYP